MRLRLPKNASAPLTFGGVDDGALGFMLAQVAKKNTGLTIAIMRDERRANQLLKEILCYAPALPTLLFPAWDAQPYDRSDPSSQVLGLRQQAFAWAQGNGHGLIITTPTAVMTKIAPSQLPPFSLEIDTDYPRATLLKTLVELGYSATEVVTEAGEFAVRGGIVDIFPPAVEAPFRLEFFDSTLEGVHPFNPLTQRTIKTFFNRVVLPSVYAFALTDKTIQLFRENWRSHFPTGVQDTLYTQVSEGVLPAGFMHYLALFFPPDVGMKSLLEANNKALICVDDHVKDAAVAFEARVVEAYKFRRDAETENTENPYRALPTEVLYDTSKQLNDSIKEHARVVLSRFTGGELKGIEGNTGALLGHLLGKNRHKAVQNAVKMLQKGYGEGKRLIITAPTAAALSRLEKTLTEHGIPAPRAVDSWAAAQKNVCSLLVSSIAHGFVAEAEGFIVLTDQDIFGDKIGNVKRKAVSDAEKFSHFSELALGDYVVHEDHGIGRFDALLTMEVPSGDGTTQQDFLKITYAGDARLFLPVENLDVLSRFQAGGMETAVNLDKLGGAAWQTRKAKIKEDLLIMAKQLMDTAAKRQLKTCVPHNLPDGLYDEFCSAFPHRLTEDQGRTMGEIEADLLAPTPMDRLVVGDVGFGKTEMAVRAAFIVAAGGRQVAITVPTTLLARQHADVFRARFKDFPFTVAVLSRLVPANVARKTKADLALGKVDIVIGTHALLADSMKFKNLGLLVIDEEQRFGVRHKERLKELKDMVDVLTLTATPIPRTLHMGLSGLKTLSTITTPPVDRLAIQTTVTPLDNKVIRDSIMRELYRDGQVYVVTPRVRDIPELEKRIKAVVPEAVIGVAHGQMPPAQLEQVMEAFYAGEFNVLIATTIVESGLDVKNANTLLVHKADRFGLSQLYQIRGRVGRAKAQGYAVLFLPETPLTEGGAKRLQVLQKLDGLGAGFLLANYDMDIRGFGNLVGQQQSGNIREIGAELYGKLLREAVTTLRAGGVGTKGAGGGDAEAEASFMPTLNVGLTYLLPDTYVRDMNERLTLYRRLAGVMTHEAVEDFSVELVERFGKLPAEAAHLMTIVGIRNRCRTLNIEKLEAGTRGVTVTFKNNTFSEPMALLAYIQARVGVVSMTATQAVTFHYPLVNDDKRLAGIDKVLGILEGLV